ncbi:hypothetical protein ACLMJK_005460 [Lecanora helva]
MAFADMDAETEALVAQMIAEDLGDAYAAQSRQVGWCIDDYEDPLSSYERGCLENPDLVEEEVWIPPTPPQEPTKSSLNLPEGATWDSSINEHPGLEPLPPAEDIPFENWADQGDSHTDATTRDAMTRDADTNEDPRNDWTTEQSTCNQTVPGLNTGVHASSPRDDNVNGNDIVNDNGAIHQRQQTSHFSNAVHCCDPSIPTSCDTSAEVNCNLSTQTTLCLRPKSHSTHDPHCPTMSDTRNTTDPLHSETMTRDNPLPNEEQQGDTITYDRTIPPKRTRGARVNFAPLDSDDDDYLSDEAPINHDGAQHTHGPAPIAPSTAKDKAKATDAAPPATAPNRFTQAHRPQTRSTSHAAINPTTDIDTSSAKNKGRAVAPTTTSPPPSPFAINRTPALDTSSAKNKGPAAAAAPINLADLLADDSGSDLTSLGPSTDDDDDVFEYVPWDPVPAHERERRQREESKVVDIVLEEGE